MVFAFRLSSLWENPYQVGRVWQSFNRALELERVGGVPWATEISTMSGGYVEAPFLQEFPLSQYLVLLLRHYTILPIAEAGQLVTVVIAVSSLIVWWVYCAYLPVSIPTRLVLAGLVVCIPGFLRYGPTAVPDAPVFLLNITGACLLFAGRRQDSNRMLIGGAILVGLSVLAKTTAAIPAIVVGIALTQEKRWEPAGALSVALLPGVVWAILAQVQNRLAAPVNEMARVSSLWQYWWNPQLYVNPWWFRNLAYMLYDSLGIFGLGAMLVAVVVAVRRKWTFEWLVVAGAATVFVLIFNYHSASHGYYHLVWLPLALVGTVEIAIKAGVSVKGVWSSSTALVVIVGLLAPLGVGERAFGLLERAAGYQSIVSSLWNAAPGVADRRLNSAMTALAKTTEEDTLVAYMGDSGAIAFTEMGRRGWVVPGPISAEAERKRRVPESVLRQAEWRQVGPSWFRDRTSRGMTVVLIEQDSTWDIRSLQRWAEEAGFRNRDIIAGHIVLRAGTVP